MWIVMVKGAGQNWVFEDFDGGTQSEAEDCAGFMNHYSDMAHERGWTYYAEEDPE